MKWDVRYEVDDDVLQKVEPVCIVGRYTSMAEPAILSVCW